MSSFIPDSVLRRIYYVLFAVSGFSGLIYESIWTHYLKLFLGHAAYSQTLVLVIFMGGMAAGAWAAGKYSQNIENLLLGYAAVEALIGIMALVFHPMFTSVTDFAYFTALPAMDSVWAAGLFKWTVSALMILPQSILLGATFPLMSAGVIRSFPGDPGRPLAVLYFSNSIGAAAGVLMSGFVFIELYGLPGTLIIAGGLNLAVAAVVTALCWRSSSLYGLSDYGAAKAGRSAGYLAMFLFCAFFTGAASFLYEIGWIRMLSLVLGSSTHAFELMLSAFILGLALGGFWIRGRIGNLANPVKTLGVIQLVMGVLALGTLLAYSQTFYFMKFAMKALDKTEQGYILFNIASHTLAMAVMLPATICAGMTLPLLTYQLLSKGYGESSIGRVYAANTAGAIVGVVFGVQFVMPELGLRNLVTIGAGIDIALGIVLLWYGAVAGQGMRRIGMSAAALSVLVFVVTKVEFDHLMMSTGVYRYGRMNTANREVLYHKDGKTATIALVRNNGTGTLSIKTNGKTDAGIRPNGEITGDLITVTIAALLPLDIHPGAKTAANIGLGSGVTGQALLTMPSIERVDTIEIEPAMVEGAKRYGKLSAKVYSDPRSHIYIEDAKTFFTSTGKTYDLIVSEPSNPWVSGVSGLFSKEFYRLVRESLNKDGLFVQWLHLYETDVPLASSVIKAVSIYFGDYDIYLAGPSDILIIASKPGSQVPEPTGELFKIPEVRKTLEGIRAYGPQDFTVRKLGGKTSLDPLFFSYDVPANSDYYPALDLLAVKKRYLLTNAKDLFNIRRAPAPIIEALEKAPAPAQPAALARNSWLFTNREGREAMAALRYFQNAAAGKTTYTRMKGKTLSTVRSVRAIHSQCEPVAMKRDWLPAVRRLAGITIPYLAPAEMKIIWDDIESAPCFPGLPGEVRNWVDLYRAVSAREFWKVEIITDNLMPASKESESTEVNDYLLTVAMLAQLVIGDRDSAMELWIRYGGDRKNPPIELRLLKETAFQRGSGRE